jgi:type II secretory pathway component GspD/PulD (secretin)
MAMDIRRIAVALAGCAAVAVATLATAADPQVLDLDPLLAAKVAKEKAKAGAASASQGKAGKGVQGVVAGEDECGVNIGNVDTGKQGPVKGIATPRENTVVITGPVINLGKCRK